MNKCSRCGRDVDAVVMGLRVQVGGHSPFSIVESPEAPVVEQVCEDCLSPQEVARHPEIMRLIVFVLDGLASGATATGMSAVETVKAYFQVRHNDAGADEKRGRAAAMRVMRTL